MHHSIYREISSWSRTDKYYFIRRKKKSAILSVVFSTTTALCYMLIDARMP